MARTLWMLCTIALGALSACGNTDFERAATGAVIGGAAAGATNNNVATGAALGAAAGALCDNAGLCPPSY